MARLAQPQHRQLGQTLVSDRPRPNRAQSFGRYNKRDTLNLARFISIAKFRPLAWRQQHPYLVADRFEDMTDPEAVRTDRGCDRTVALYGYVRGAGLRAGMLARTPARRRRLGAPACPDLSVALRADAPGWDGRHAHGGRRGPAGSLPASGRFEAALAG